MAIVTKQNIGLMALMALCTFDVAGISDMVFMRVGIEVFRPLRDSLQRFVAVETSRCGSRRFGLRLLVAGLALEAPFLVAIRGKCGLFLGDGEPGQEHGKCSKKAKYPFKHSISPCK
jgi:hypothetical protein